ncbi:hypothetical protein [Methylobacterium nigriterrae]|uniref:hypothetical protein n=1 Tax=Methylobacterium nigriterrae TaxID=3127512 RepID=UPI0030134E93
MRDTLAAIDTAVSDKRVTEALYYLATEQLAAQALALAAHRRSEPATSEQAARSWIDAIAGGPGITERHMPGSSRTIGEVAAVRLARLVMAETPG